MCYLFLTHLPWLLQVQTKTAIQHDSMNSKQGNLRQVIVTTDLRYRIEILLFLFDLSFAKALSIQHFDAHDVTRRCRGLALDFDLNNRSTNVVHTCNNCTSSNQLYGIAHTYTPPAHLQVGSLRTTHQVFHQTNL